jgi:hypothetical protein
MPINHLHTKNFPRRKIPENPSFNKRFESIVRNMTRKEVISILGFPDVIYNKTRIERVYCPQADVDVGVASMKSVTYGPFTRFPTIKRRKEYY